MKKIRRIEISVAVALIVSLVFSVVGFAAECKQIRSNVVRLHILANSDSEEDQAVKLLVRDALLESGSEIFSGYTDTKAVENCLNKEKEKLISVAESVLEENGFDYGADIVLVSEYFAERAYEGFTMPAGEYLALRVILGNGEGHNWWCVMFPPLCLPAATERVELDAFFGENGAEIVASPAKYEVRLKIIDLFESVRAKFKD